MTREEARIVLGLREDDAVTEAGLLMLKESRTALCAQTVSKQSKSKCTREIKAIDRLLQGLMDDKALAGSISRCERR